MNCIVGYPVTARLCFCEHGLDAEIQTDTIFDYWVIMNKEDSYLFV